MKLRPSPATLTSRPFLLWSTFAMKTVQISAAATQVVAIRSARLAAAAIAPQAADHGEFALMGTEKLDAFARAGHAIASGALPLAAGMAGQALRGSLDLAVAATQLAASRTLPQTMQRQRALAHVLMRHAPVAQHGALATATARFAHRALEPVHAVATANARRLAKPQGRPDLQA
jgi:hypothetical protein